MVTSARGVVWPLALYVDGVPFQRRDSLIAFYVYNLVTQVRHLMAVLRKSGICTCGCQGWCSLSPLFFFLRWSFEALATGHAPQKRHDGQPFGPGDEQWAAQAGHRIAKGALVQVKGDWAEFVRAFGLVAWNSTLHPCFCCHCTRDALYEVGHTSPVSGPMFPGRPTTPTRRLVQGARCVFASVTGGSSQHSQVFRTTTKPSRAAKAVLFGKTCLR